MREQEKAQIAADDLRLKADPGDTKCDYCTRKAIYLQTTKRHGEVVKTERVCDRHKAASAKLAP